MDEGDKCVLTAICGFVAGAGLIFVLDKISDHTYGNAKVFRDENKTPVMRLYRGGSDQILVGVDETGSDYIKLETHLKNFQEQADRNIERARIEKLVKWYD